MMVRLRHNAIGSVVSIPEEKAARMGSEWEPVEEPTEKKAAAKRSTTTKK